MYLNQELKRCPVCNEFYRAHDARHNRPRRFCSLKCWSAYANVVQWNPPPETDFRPGWHSQYLVPIVEV